MTGRAILLFYLPFHLLGIAACWGAAHNGGDENRAADGGPPGSLHTFKPDSLFDVARGIYFSGHYDSASVLLRAIAEEARRNGVVEAEARATTWLGLAAWRLGDYREAQRLGEEGLDLKLRENLTDQLFRSYNALGLLAWNENRLTEAARLYEEAISWARQNGSRLEEGTAIGNLGLVHTELGDFAKARDEFLATRQTMAELDNTRLEGNALTNLGMLTIRTGNPRAALGFLRDARRVYRAGGGYPTGEQSALGHLGTAYAALGESKRAYAALDTALQQARAQGLRQDEASNLEAIAELYRRAADHRRALALYAEAQVINEELGLDVETGADLRGEAEIHLGLNDAARAWQLATEALTIHQSAGARQDVMYDHLVLAEIAHRLGRDARVREQLQSARELAGELEARSARVDLALTEARIADRQRRSQVVLDVVERVRDDLARGGYATAWRAYHLESRAHARLDHMNAAAASGRQAVAAVERVRGNFGSGMLRTTYAADKREVYADLVTVLLRLGEVDEAFETADAARARALLERLATTSNGQGASGSTTRVLKEGETLLREMDRLIESIDYTEETPPKERTEDQLSELDHLYQRLDSLRSDYEERLVRATETDPRATALLGGTHVSADDVRRALNPGQVLIEYLVTAQERLIIFVVTRDEIQVLESAITEQNLATRVRLARDLIGRANASQESSRTVTEGLHEILMGPVLRSGVLGNARDLVVVPHQVLNYLPFGVLRDPTTGRYLIQDHTLQVLPSAAALPSLRSRAATAASVQTATGSAFAPFPDVLPATRDEVQMVRASLGGGRLAVGSMATESALRQALQGNGLVHVATHGVMNPKNPMFSRLELSPAGTGASNDDGRLEVHEILSLSIHAPLVFLSGCETGLGTAWSTEYSRGEDLATLAQAFLYAGAQHVIATLWAVEDQGAAAFAGRFYERLRTSSPTAALAAAQRDLLDDPDYESPYYWAPYQLAGAGR